MEASSEGSEGWIQMRWKADGAGVVEGRAGGRGESRRKQAKLRGSVRKRTSNTGVLGCASCHPHLHTGLENVQRADEGRGQST